MKILFITANRLGDAVLSTGVLAWLVERNPGAQITIACGPYAAGLFRAVPGVERLILLRKQPWNRHWLDFWLQGIGTRWDLIVDMRNTAAARFLIAGKRIHRGGSSGMHKVIENARVIDANPPPSPHIWVDAKAEQEAAKILPKQRPFIALGPAANWPPKQWPAEHFAALAQKLTAADGPFPGAAVIVIAGDNERALVEPLMATLPAGQIFPVIGQELAAVAACLKASALFVGNDSGLMHMAAAVGIPTLGLFGPGEEDIYGPWGPNCAYVRTPETREELLRRLPHPGAFAPNLMETLSVDKAYAAVGNLLKHSAKN